MVITRVARVALRRQAIATTIISRPIPAYARLSSFTDAFKTRRVAGEVRESTETKPIEGEAETKLSDTQAAETKLAETEAAETKPSDAQAAEVQPAKKPPFETVPVETPSSEGQLNKDEPAKDQSAKEEPKETSKGSSQSGQPIKDKSAQDQSVKGETKETPKGSFRGGRRADRSKRKEKAPYESRYGSKWITTLNKRLFALQERQRTKMDIPPSIWKEIGRVEASVKQSWSRVFAASEGFLTPKEGVGGLWKQHVAWGEMDNLGHVNNVVYNKYAEASRINWISGLAGYRKDNTIEERQLYRDFLTPQATGLVLRSIKTHFKFPLTYPDRVSAFHKIVKPPEPGSDNMILEALVVSEYHYRVAARFIEDLVIYDHMKGRNTTFKPNQIRDLTRLFRRQLQSRENADKEIDEWMDRLTDLEMKVQIKGGHLRDLSLKDDPVESAINDALRATDELEAADSVESEFGREDLNELEPYESPEHGVSNPAEPKEPVSDAPKATGWFKKLFKWS